MERPRFPRWWRSTIIVLGLLPLLMAAPTLLPMLGMGPAFILWALGSLGWGLALAFGMIRRGGRELVAALAGFAGAILYAMVGETPFHLLAGIGTCMAVALAIARPDPIPSALAVTGFAAQTMTMRALNAYRGPIDSIPGWPNAIMVGATLLLSGGLVAYGLRARVEPATATASSGLGPAPRIASIALGVVLLAIAWLAGGSFAFIPIWPLAFALILLPALLRWRAWPMGAVVVAAIALAGGVPAGVCTAHPWSDAVGPDGESLTPAYPRVVTLVGAVGNGPDWSASNGFSGLRVECPTSVLALGAGWALVLTTAASIVAWGRRAPPHSLPPAIS